MVKYNLKDILEKRLKIKYYNHIISDNHLSFNKLFISLIPFPAALELDMLLSLFLLKLLEL